MYGKSLKRGTNKKSKAASKSAKSAKKAVRKFTSKKKY